MVLSPHDHCHCPSASKHRVHQILGQADRAHGSFIKATSGSLEPASQLYYNDQPPDLIFYQGMANTKLRRESTAQAIFSQLVDYGEKHLVEQVTIDYFAVSLPDFLVFDQDLNLQNRIHCHYMQGLGYLGLGENTQAIEHFRKVLSLNVYHIGATIHLASLKPHQGTTDLSDQRES